MTDAQLLSRFAEHRDQQAFADLVKLHGPMVYGVCRRILRNHHDAEDAFQATFLVLARKGPTIARPALIANWLYVVAHHVSTKAQAAVNRRSARVLPIDDVPEPSAVPLKTWTELAPVLDRELRRLTEKYRVPVILCDLEGKTRKEAARQLGWAEATVTTRLMKARAVLAQRLARQGFALSAGTLALLLSQHAASAAAPASLVASTITAAGAISVGQAVPVGIVSVKAAELSRQMLTTLLLTKINVVVGIVVALAATGIGLNNVQWMKAAPATVDGIPAEIHAALEQNAKAIHSIGICYTTEIRSRLSEAETFEKLQIKPDRASPILFAKRPFRTIVDGQRFYTSEIVESLTPSGKLIVVSNEGSFDGAVLYDGSKHEPLNDGLPGTLRKYNWERQRKSNRSIKAHVRGPYFAGAPWAPSYSGLSLTRKSSQQSELSPESDILRLLRLKANLKSVENVSLDDRALVKIELIAENETREEAGWIDLKKLEDDDSEELATKEERRRTAENVRRQQKLPAKKRIVYFLDPALNYAVRRREEWYDPHTLLVRCDCSDFEKLPDHSVWLPRRCESEIHELHTQLYYKWPDFSLLVPQLTFQFDDSFLTEIVEVTELTQPPFPAEQFVLNYTEPGIYIEDHTLPEAERSQFGGIGYRLGQTLEQTSQNLALAIEKQTNGKDRQQRRGRATRQADARRWTPLNWFILANIIVLPLVASIVVARRFVTRKSDRSRAT